MITATDQPDVAQYSARARESLGGIMAHWKPCGEPFELPPQTSLFAMRPGGGAAGADVFCVREGQLSYIREEKPIVHYDEGSLVGLLGEGERDEIQVRPTFDDRPTTVSPFRIADLRGELSKQPELALLWARLRPGRFSASWRRWRSTTCPSCRRLRRESPGSRPEPR